MAAAPAEAAKYVTSPELMFNEASGRTQPIPPDVSSETSLQQQQQLDSQRYQREDLESGFNHVSSHQHLQVIKKPPANEVVSSHYSTLEHSGLHDVFSRYSNLSGLRGWKCTETSSETQQRDKFRITPIHPRGETAITGQKGGRHYRPAEHDTFTAAVFEERL